MSIVNSQLLNNFLDAFLDAISSEKNVSQNTIESYYYDIKDFLKNISEHNYEIFSVDIQNISSYIEFLRNKKLSERTLARKIISIKNFFSFLFDDGIIKKNPMTEIDLPKFETKLPKIISVENVNKIFNFLDGVTSFEKIRNALMIELLYAAGLRASELISLKLNNFPRNVVTNEFENYLIVSGKGGAERKIPLHEKSISLLKKYLKIKFLSETNGFENNKINLKTIKKNNERKKITTNLEERIETQNKIEKNIVMHNETNESSSDIKKKISQKNLNGKKLNLNFLFPSNSRSGHISRQRLGQILKKIAENVGLNLKKISPHVLRHAFATHMMENGANILVIKKLLGHKDISTTEIYTHVNPLHVMELVKKHHPLSKEKLKMVHRDVVEKESAK